MKDLMNDPLLVAGIAVIVLQAVVAGFGIWFLFKK